MKILKRQTNLVLYNNMRVCKTGQFVIEESVSECESVKLSVVR